MKTEKNTKIKEFIYRKKENIHNVKKETEIILIFDNGEEFTGIYQGLNNEQILLKSSSSDYTIGLPLYRLVEFWERTK